MIAKPVLNQARPTAERPCAHRGWKKKPSLGRFLFPGLFAFSLLIFCGAFQISAQQLITDVNPLALPEIGSYGLRVLSPNVLELTLITTKQPDPARVSAWDFVDGNFNATLPPVSEFAVTVNNQMVSVTAVGFKRRVLSAPEKPGDLRIASEIYLTLGASIADGQSVEVKNPSSTLWKDPVKYVATKDALRLSPVLHVSQLGYMPSYPKKAMVGYYLGSLGELPIPTEVGFQLIDSQTGATVYHGKLTLRADVGFSYAPLPYQEVYQADFTAFSTPGEYRLVVPGLGESFPFRIDDGVTAGFARTFALGLFNQRCGSGNYLPFTRHTHDPCHIAPAQIPTMDAEFSEVQDVLRLVTGDYLDETLQTAPSLENVAASLYPFVNHGTVDVSGGHHDAGDYSKYTINSAGLTHFLVFAADSFPGVGSLDNLGTPESGDGKSDILEEAKWEADFLAKMQDADGGFYFLVYPKDRRYENNVLPDHGDPQVVFPKTTSVTAAAVAALAEAGSSPLMKAQFPTEAANYLRKAQLGWTFLMNAIAKYGKLGAYQKITHYGNEWGHDDELAWAAAALYAATGDAQYQSKLFEFFPDPNDVSTRRWTWWRLFEGYGCAVRTYAFAARSGRLPASKLDQSYLGKCEAEIIATGDDHVRFSQESAYGTSFPDTTKEYRSPGWYFSSERAFDVTVAYQVTPRPEYLETVMANCNYEAGVNPLNMTYITGIGFKREREIVSQYAWNDQRIL
ncbi:MAG TPA: glycoside hydrolase family 9 protein, partial [Verrucomicrobiae bacterium]|nr:glycoside hydrolase family 9 protein [Verrucomicrobiae bacterium]